MNYRITKGDLEITKNVLKKLGRQLSHSLIKEIEHFEVQTDCPSYETYNMVMDILVYINIKHKDLTS